MDSSGLSVADDAAERSLSTSPSGSLLSPPGTPTRPKRNPMRPVSTSNLREAAKGHAAQTEGEARVLLMETSRLKDRMYEAQELRHSTSAPLERLNTLLSDLSTQMADLAPRIEALLGRAAEDGARLGQALGLDDLSEEWAKTQRRYAVLNEEMKEDGWLIRFRTTADQAEAMMDPLDNSHIALSAYVERISSSPYEIPYSASVHGDLSVEELVKLNKAHASMKSTYVPSIVKILKMIDRSLTERSTKNGEALRRYGDMVTRWTTLQRSLAQLDARVQLALSQYEIEGGMERVEILDDTVSSPSDRLRAEGDYFGTGATKARAHRPSLSSGSNSTLNSPNIQSRPGVSPGPSLGAGTPSGSLRRRTSMMSTASTTTPRHEKPRWNISTRVDYSADQASQGTPINKRMSSFGYTGLGSPRASLTPGARGTSPTPSSISGMTTSSRLPYGSGQSRIPVASPQSRRLVSGHSAPLAPGSPPIPGLAVSTTTTHMSLLDARTHETPQHAPAYRAPHTTHASRLSLPRSSTAPAHQSLSAPRARLSRGGPPSSYRPTTPSPLPTSTPSLSFSRPTSRLSYAGGSVRGAEQDLKPFIPSKYDALDQAVALAIQAEGFELFVARLDAPLKRGQSRRDGEEWKGEYVFGAGERSCSVKLLTIASVRAGRGKDGREEGQRTRCMVRKGGMWVSLAELLRERKDKHGEVF